MKSRAAIPILILATAVILLVAPFWGMKHIALSDVVGTGTADWTSTLFWNMRVPRTLTGFLAGACLALSGLVFQAIFRNALATPFTLGVSSGASLGGVLFLRVGIPFTVLGLSGTSLSAFAGAVLSIFLVYGLIRATGAFSTSRLLLAGVAVSFFCSSLIMFVHYTSNFQDVFRLMRWLMGGLSVSGYDAVRTLSVFAVGGGLLLWFFAHELNLLATGEEIALSRGVDVSRMRHALLITTSLMEGCVVAMCGPIGFVGIMVPHSCRLLVGSNHRRLVPAAFLLGGAFLVICDTVARTVANPAEVPVGVITALLGGPFFLWLLLTGKAEDIEL